MTHLLTKMVPQAELREMFDSAKTQEFLKENSQKTTGKEPFLYQYISTDNPHENLAVVVIFPGADVVWIELLVLGDVQYIPEYPSA
jgi:hypothetical protein